VAFDPTVIKLWSTIIKKFPSSGDWMDADISTTLQNMLVTKGLQ